MECLRILKYCALVVALTMGPCSLSMDSGYIKSVYGDYNNSSDKESDDSGFYTSIYDINDINVYHNYVDENNSDINIYNHISDQIGLAFNDFTSSPEQRFEFKKWWLRGPKTVLTLDDIREYYVIDDKKSCFIKDENKDYWIVYQHHLKRHYLFNQLDKLEQKVKEKTYSDVKEEYHLLYQKKRLFDLATGVVAGIIGKIIYDNRAKIQKKAVDTVKKVSCNIQ